MRALGYGWWAQTVSSTEHGKRRPMAEEIFGLAQVPGTTVDDLMRMT